MLARVTSQRNLVVSDEAESSGGQLQPSILWPATRRGLMTGERNKRRPRRYGAETGRPLVTYEAPAGSGLAFPDLSQECNAFSFEGRGVKGSPGVMYHDRVC
jgi:hypothetical protein